MKAPAPVDHRLTRPIVLAAVVSLVAWIGLESFSPRPTVSWSEEMHEAAGRMGEAIAVVAGFHRTAGIRIDEALDPNRTGLIGPEYTELFTTLGHLEAKRTTTNPDLAALMGHLLGRAGVAPGDTIAVGASASFPALLIAALTASEALGVHPVVIVSLGSSSYGATRPNLDLLRIYRLLLAAGVISTPPAAISLGGEGDMGADFEPAFREVLLERIRRSGVPLVQEPELRENVARRMAIYFGAGEVVAPGDSAPDSQVDAPGDSAPDSEGAGARRIAAFVNIGGNEANMGTSPMILGVAPGLNESLRQPTSAQRGVLYEMSAQGVPVIHLLHVRGLALAHSLPWDPIPLPEPGTTPLSSDEDSRGVPFWIIMGGYVVALLFIAGTARAGRVKQIG